VNLPDLGSTKDPEGGIRLHREGYGKRIFLSAASIYPSLQPLPHCNDGHILGYGAAYKFVIGTFKGRGHYIDRIAR
jgi:hypothetical protein